MKSAVVERLADLIAVATGLRDMIEADGKAALPGLVVCRVAVSADHAAAELSALLDTLASATTPVAARSAGK
jgi:hypothetical protein